MHGPDVPIALQVLAQERGSEVPVHRVPGPLSHHQLLLGHLPDHQQPVSIPLAHRQHFPPPGSRSPGLWRIDPEGGPFYFTQGGHFYLHATAFVPILLVAVTREGQIPDASTGKLNGDDHGPGILTAIRETEA